MKKFFTLPKLNLRRFLTITGVIILSLYLVSVAAADVITRIHVRGTVPNPGTQQQELANITFPAPYNVFEFVVTCAGCHGGSIDQQVAHFSNWAGTSMASAARDPIFRANQIGVNEAVKNLTGVDGAGNMCMRCHSPNGWYSGRFDPILGGDPRGTTMIQSPLLSTDAEGVTCDLCHRAIGNVTYKDPNIDPADPVWNMMAGATDWPHAGNPFVDQAGDPTIAPGNPFGDTTLQLLDGMTYVGKYSGTSDIYVNDIPLEGTYTGQTYGVYPPGWIDANGVDVGGQPVVNPDGSLPIQNEVPVGPPLNPNGTTNYMAQSLSIEHPTVGNREGLLPAPIPDANKFITSSDFCGTCHELTVPVLNHGMPEQRTFTEWKYSDFGTNDVTCQECHMPTMKSEFADNAPVTLNADPLLAGWFPYAKDRNAQGGVSVHKFAGANRDLPMMMKELYPEVDLEILGAPTGNDVRIFPGMLSNRDSMWDRALRNTEISLQDAVDVEVLSAPQYNAGTGRWSMQVKVTNKTGHRLPSGYPDGRRLYLGINVTDNLGGVVYQSGYYNQDTATLFTDSAQSGFARALENVIDSNSNAVMVYERVTGTCDAGLTTCTPSQSLLNDKILFDNRINPAGFDYAKYREAGVKFWNYDPATNVPFEDLDRYTSGQNYDIVTYVFDAPADANLSVRAEAYWQSHTRDFMEHLKNQDNSTVRPEGPPSIYAVNYPLTPTYLSDRIGLATMTDLEGQPLKDNWGGVAYASWLLTGKGAPYLVAVADTEATALAAPAAPAVQLVDPFTARFSWAPVAGADGYVVYLRYGANDATASWDKLAVVYGTELTNTAMNVAKTYGVKIQAFNGNGNSPDSPVTVFTTPIDLPFPPENLQVIGTTPTSVSMSWIDVADNEVGFIIERQDVPVIGGFYPIDDIPSATAGFANGGNTYTDLTAQSGSCYNYRVAAYNASGNSTWNVNGPVQGCTTQAPGGISVLTATATNSFLVNLSWNAANGTITGYRVERSINGGTTWNVTFNVPTPNATGFADNTAQPNNTYTYRVFAYNAFGDSPSTNIATVTTPPAALSILRASANPTSAASVNFIVTFSSSVTDVDAADFVLAPAGITGASITSVTGTPGSTRTVTVATGTGEGTLGLNLVDNNTILDLAGTFLGGNALGDGNVTGQTYTIDRPAVNWIKLASPNPTGAASVNFSVSFSRSVTGVDKTDFALTASGVTGASVTSVSGTGADYTVTVNTGSNSGTLRLNLNDNGSIKDVNGIPLGGAGVQNYTAGETYTIDKTPPTAPSGLTGVTPVSFPPQQVTLSWTDTSTIETGFIIQRAPQVGNFQTIKTINTPNTTSYVDLTVQPATTYRYQVFAFNLAGNSLLPSNMVTIKTPVIAPAAPTNLVSTLQSGPWRVSLKWRDNATTETGFVIERSVNGGAFAQLTTRPTRNGTGNVNYTDNGVVAGNTYAYQVKAVIGTTPSAYSNTVTVAIPTPPAAPSNLAGSAVSIAGNNNQDKVTLTWLDNANNETGYVIQRSTSQNFNNASTYNIAANLTSFTQNVSRTQNFYYRIRATNAAGNSGWSNVLYVTTP